MPFVALKSSSTMIAAAIGRRRDMAPPKPDFPAGLAPFAFISPTQEQLLNKANVWRASDAMPWLDRTWL